ncbi:MAG: quinone-dependent dihydroorotate dehydrogenase [Rhodothermales bacterium]
MYDFIRSALFRLDAERAHRLTAAAARAAHLTRADSLLESRFHFEDERLRQTLWGLTFSNPVGLAAGFDKNAALVGFWPALGFGFVEVGSVSARPSRGNPRPRAFRLPDDLALVNRMGLNNIGAKRISRRLKHAGGRMPIPIGVNLAKTHDPKIMGDAAIDDFRESFRRLAPLADYIALNVSCPNTTDGKTFEEPAAFERLLEAMDEERAGLAIGVPILVKLSPPISDRVVFDSAVDEMVSVSRRFGVSGFIAANTASDREGLLSTEEEIRQAGAGGLSGKPIQRRATSLVRYLYRLTGGAMPIIGVGGVFTAEDAYEKIRAGASLIQIYTGLIYNGPGVVRRIKEGLVDLLVRDGHSSIADAVGANA